MVDDLSPRPGTEQGEHGCGMGVVVLHDDEPTGAHDPCHSGHQRIDEVHALVAGEQGMVGLMVEDVAGHVRGT